MPRTEALDIRPHDLSEADVRLLACMPRLHELMADTVAINADCSGLVCTWTRLVLTHVPTPRQLLCLPLSGLRELECEHWSWSLGLEGTMAITAADVRMAAKLLAPFWAPQDPSNSHLHLTWEQPDTSCTEVLAALQPLQQIPGLRLDLHGFYLDVPDMQALASALPAVTKLCLHGCNISMGAFSEFFMD